jgi:hypothetical protein
MLPKSLPDAASSGLSALISAWSLQDVTWRKMAAVDNGCPAPARDRSHSGLQRQRKGHAELATLSVRMSKVSAAVTQRAQASEQGAAQAKHRDTRGGRLTEAVRVDERS